MGAHYDLILRGGALVAPDGVVTGDIAAVDGRIAALGDLASASASETMTITGLHVLPGVLDTQVHFREPGDAHKEDLETGSRAAVLGGVAGVFEMPNTHPPTTTPAALQDKLARARGRMHCDYAFYAGGTAANAGLLADLERMPGCCGVKVFMGSSTGPLLAPDDGAVRSILRQVRRRAAFHAEDEPRLQARLPLAQDGRVETHPVWRDAETARLATARLLALAQEMGRRVHVLHVSTAQEMDLLARHRGLASVEVTPQHLTLEAPDCYEALGTRAQMNPPIRGAAHRAALWRAVERGVVDVIGSDHAPHTAEEKARAYPGTPSGMPGVQTLVPIMLDHVHAGRLSLTRLASLTRHAPARLFGLQGKDGLRIGQDADFTVADLKAERTIEERWIASRCGWTPFAGRKVTGWPVGTFVRGRRVMWEGSLLAPATGLPMRFRRGAGTKEPHRA